VKFAERLEDAARRNESHLCVGLDPDPRDVPDESLLEWAHNIVDATKDLVCCYKPNSAFYEVRGPVGWMALKEIIASIPNGLPVILDAKRADVPNTAIAYARAAFETLGAGAVTISPYMGTDSVAPFLAYPDNAVFVCCRTSNAGASEFQDLTVTDGRQTRMLFEQVACVALEWARTGPAGVGLVAGATNPEHIRQIRAICGDQWLLVPGVGPQGGDLERAVLAAQDRSGGRFFINASRSVAAPPSQAHYAELAEGSARSLRAKIEAVLPVPA